MKTTRTKRLILKPMKKLVLGTMLVGGLIACKKPKDENPCDAPKHTTTYVMGERTGTYAEYYDAIKAMRDPIKKSADSCLVGEVHFKFNGKLNDFSHSRMDNVWEAVQEAFSMSSGKANGGKDTVRLNAIYGDTKLAMEAAKYVIIAGQELPRN